MFVVIWPCIVFGDVHVADSAGYDLLKAGLIDTVITWLKPVYPQ